jgi:hypothetical protein
MLTIDGYTLREPLLASSHAIVVRATQNRTGERVTLNRVSRRRPWLTRSERRAPSSV